MLPFKKRNVFNLRFGRSETCERMTWCWKFCILVNLLLCFDLFSFFQVFLFLSKLFLISYKIRKLVTFLCVLLILYENFQYIVEFFIIMSPLFTLLNLAWIFNDFALLLDRLFWNVVFALKRKLIIFLFLPFFLHSLFLLLLHFLSCLDVISL